MAHAEVGFAHCAGRYQGGGSNERSVYRAGGIRIKIQQYEWPHTLKDF